MQLSGLVDLIGLRTYIIKKTPKGKSKEPDPWAHTRAAIATYAPKADPAEVIGLFEQAGCNSDVEAVRWLLKHDELVP
jgi:hypothetical protein